MCFYMYGLDPMAHYGPFPNVHVVQYPLGLPGIANVGTAEQDGGVADGVRLVGLYLSLN